MDVGYVAHRRHNTHSSPLDTVVYHGPREDHRDPGCEQEDILQV